MEPARHDGPDEDVGDDTEDYREGNHAITDPQWVSCKSRGHHCLPLDTDR